MGMGKVVLVLEPTALISSLYNAFIYTILFILLEVRVSLSLFLLFSRACNSPASFLLQTYPIVYRLIYHFGLGTTGLVLLAPFLGNIFGAFVYFGFFRHRYAVREARIARSTMSSPGSSPRPQTTPSAGSSTIGARSS
jgi:hypothetical protein